MTIADRLFASIRDLVMCHSPSGAEEKIDVLLKDRFRAAGLTVHADPCGNLIGKIPGRGGGRLAITAHKDEIGAVVTGVKDGGRLKLRRVGASFPWIYGEGVVDILGEQRCIQGILSFGSRHVSHASPQHAQQQSAPLRWEDAWIETKLTAQELAAAGVRAGTRVVIGKHRKAPLRMADHVASYTLDNKASLAILLELAERIQKPDPDVYLVASAKEEVGALGALYFAQRQELDALIALEVVPIAPEYDIEDGPVPVLLAEDHFGLYDLSLNASIRAAAAQSKIPLQVSVVSSFGSDGSLAMKAGHVPRAACLGFPTQNTHGYEIAHLEAIGNCVRILEAVCQSPMTSRGIR